MIIDNTIDFPMKKDGLKTLLASNLGLTPGESLAFIHDQAFTSLVDPIYRHCADLGVHLRVVSTSYDGLRPLPQDIKDIILDAQFGVVIFGVVHNIWHTPERKQAKYVLGKRLASIVCSPERMNYSASASNIPLIASASRQFSELLPARASVRITSPSGCDFTAIVGKPFCEHGEYQMSGNGGDFPAGEVGFGPEVGSVSGRIVYDVKVQHLGLLDSPLVLNVKRDKITEVIGSYRDAFIDLCAQRGDMLNYISEISVGLNPFVGITSEPEFIPEEKTYGTAHCGHGGNASYGTRVGAHIDGVIKAPTIEINGVCVMEKGLLQPHVLSGDIIDWLNTFNVSNQDARE